MVPQAAHFTQPGEPVNGSASEIVGATAVVEGVGDHGCEYMTAGGSCDSWRNG